jgi:hypothetical protein
LGTYNLAGDTGAFSLTGVDQDFSWSLIISDAGQPYSLTFSDVLSVKWLLSGAFDDTCRINASLVVGYGAALSETCDLTDIVARVYATDGSLIETLSLHQLLGPLAVYHLGVSDRMRLTGVVVTAVTAYLSHGLNLTAALSVTQAMILFEALSLEDQFSLNGQLLAELVDKLNLHDTIQRLIGGALSDALALTHGNVAVYAGMAIIADEVLVTDDLLPTFQIMVFAADTLELDDEFVLQGIYNGLLADQLSFANSYLIPGDSSTTWALNTRTGSLTEYTNFTFNSLVRMGLSGITYLGADSTGLYKLNGDDDAGVPIISDIIGGLVQFTGSHFTSFKTVYLGVRASGKFILKLMTGDGKKYVYAVNAQPMKTTRVELGKGLRARYFSWELISTGQDFDLDGIEFLPIMSERRI